MQPPEDLWSSGGFPPHTGFLPALLFFVFFAAVPLGTRFVAEETKNGRLLYAGSIHPGEIFAISYTHSVNKSEVVDYFTVGKDGGIVLTGSRFLSFGAGVANEPEGSGTFSAAGDHLAYTGLDRAVPDLRVFAGTEADHRFISAGEEFRFLERTAPGTSVRFVVRKMTLAESAAYYVLKGVHHARR